MNQEIRSVYLKPGRERAVINCHPWLFSGAVLKKDQRVDIGDEVLIKDHQGHPMALGYWCSNEGLVCRIMTFISTEKLDDDFFIDRFNKALKLRHCIGLPNKETTGYRLIHGEGDGLSGLVCDVFGEMASIQLSNPGLNKVIDIFADFLRQKLNIKNIYFYDSLRDEAEWLLGQRSDAPFIEQSLFFIADIEEGQKTGYFLDQRDNRQLVKELAKDRRVLDSFCYSGGFSVYALAGGARFVTSVDISKSALSLVQKNVANNGFTGLHQAYEADCFSFLRGIKKDDFDLIILDPPAFAKSAQSVDRAARGYKDINLLAFKAIRSGGLVLTFSCSQHISEDLLQKIIFAAAKDAARDVKIIRRLTQGADHPVSVYCPQSHYLKGFALYVE